MTLQYSTRLDNDVTCLLASLTVWIFHNLYQGSRLCRPSMLNTRYFRFGREFWLSERDFYIENISALEANFSLQEA